MGHEELPRGLTNLVTSALAPGTRVQRSGKTAIDGSWWFELIWAGKTFELRVPTEEWTDGQRDLISLNGRLAAPAPEATRGGRSLWIRGCGRRIASDTFNFEFELLRQPQAAPRIAWLRVPVPTAVGFAQRAREIDREPHAHLLAIVLWDLKDRIDDGSESSTETIRHTVGPKIPPRQRATETEVQSYVARKLRLAYQVAGQGASLVFDWTDLDYLGIARDDFTRAVSIRDRKDWVLTGLTLSPTRRFAEQCDASLIESEGDDG